MIKLTDIQVKDLLSLKQQQASVVQAWQAAKQSEETVKQGRSIMVFTIVTIIFVSIALHRMYFTNVPSFHYPSCLVCSE